MLKHPQSKRFARFGDARWSRQSRLAGDCVRFTAAIPAGQLCCRASGAGHGQTIRLKTKTLHWIQWSVMV